MLVRPAEEAVRTHEITIRLELLLIERKIDHVANVSELERAPKAGVQVLVAELTAPFPGILWILLSRKRIDRLYPFQTFTQ